VFSGDLVDGDGVTGRNVGVALGRALAGLADDGEGVIGETVGIFVGTGVGKRVGEADGDAVRGACVG